MSAYEKAPILYFDFYLTSSMLDVQSKLGKIWRTNGLSSVALYSLHDLCQTATNCTPWNWVKMLLVLNFLTAIKSEVFTSGKDLWKDWNILFNFYWINYLASCEVVQFLLPGMGGIETEAVMLGMPVALTLPEVVGCELTGSASLLATSIDIVLSITKVNLSSLWC